MSIFWTIKYLHYRPNPLFPLPQFKSQKSIILQQCTLNLVLVSYQDTLIRRDRSDHFGSTHHRFLVETCRSFYGRKASIFTIFSLCWLHHERPPWLRLVSSWGPSTRMNNKKWKFENPFKILLRDLLYICSYVQR